MTINLLSGRQPHAKWMSRRSRVREVIGQGDVERPCQVSHHGHRVGPTHNGSRLSCGRLARRRKGRGRTSVPARARHNGFLWNESARQLQALVRRLASRVCTWYTTSMKTAISVPDRLFGAADALARKL